MEGDLIDMNEFVMESLWKKREMKNNFKRRNFFGIFQEEEKLKVSFEGKTEKNSKF